MVDKKDYSKKQMREACLYGMKKCGDKTNQSYEAGIDIDLFLEEQYNCIGINQKTEKKCYSCDSKFLCAYMVEYLLNTEKIKKTLTDKELIVRSINIVKEGISCIEGILDIRED